MIEVFGINAGFSYVGLKRALLQDKGNDYKTRGRNNIPILRNHAII